MRTAQKCVSTIANLVDLRSPIEDLKVRSLESHDEPIEPHQSLIQPGRALSPARVFVGGFIRRVTPVPIPNTVVKPAEPMILRQRESRSLPALNKSPGLRKKIGVLFSDLKTIRQTLMVTVAEPVLLY